MKTIIDKARELFKNRIKKVGYDPYGLVKHVEEVEKWADYLCDHHPQADRRTVLLGVWLHDLGHYPLPAEVDHAIRSEELARKFFKKEKYPAKKTEQALHCIRAHRCHDVLPETIEAKIVACADSASHMTDDIYIGMARDDKSLRQSFRAYGKMDRDYRDIAAFPEIKKFLTPVYRAWKKLIQEYEKIDL
jgi:HD superfamily phosphodiesterase